MEGEVLKRMAHIIKAYAARAQETPVSVVTAHVEGTAVTLPKELKMRGTLVRPVVHRIGMTSVSVVEELIIGLTSIVYRHKL